MVKSYNQTILKEDAQGNVVQDTFYADMAFRGEYDGDGFLVYKGYARPGADEDAAVWQLALLDSDADGNVTSITWPQADNGAASSEYIFAWTDRATYTYS